MALPPQVGAWGHGTAGCAERFICGNCELPFADRSNRSRGNIAKNVVPPANVDRPHERLEGQRAWLIPLLLPTALRKSPRPAAPEPLTYCSQ
jgi:hypothetical protein